MQIARLTESDRPEIAAHLLRLDRDARQRRFGSGLKDSAVSAYAAKIDLVSGRLFGTFRQGRLIGLAEVFPEGHDGVVEAAFSVDTDQRGQGIAAQLMDRVLEVAALEGYRTVVLYIQQANAPMRAVARKHGFALSLQDGDYVARRQVDAKAFLAGLKAVAPACA